MLNPGGANYGWNYSKPDKPGYSTQLVGTVVAIQEVQKMGFTMNGQPGAPEFWPDGNPKMNIRLALCTKDGEIKTFTFQPAGKDARMGKKKSVHMDLFALTGNTDMMNLIGETICIQTQEGHYGQGNPRPWNVSLVENDEPYMPNTPLPAEFLAPQVLANNAVNGGQLNAPQQQQQQYYRPPQYSQHLQQQQYQPPQQPHLQQSQLPQQWGQNYMQQPPQMQYQKPQLMQQPPRQAQPMMQQPQQNGYPNGMDPNIAAQMAQQVFGPGVQVTMEPAPQPVNPVGSGEAYDDYDEDMPF